MTKDPIVAVLKKSCNTLADVIRLYVEEHEQRKDHVAKDCYECVSAMITLQGLEKELDKVIENELQKR